MMKLKKDRTACLPDSEPRVFALLRLDNNILLSATIHTKDARHSFALPAPQARGYSAIQSIV